MAGQTLDEERIDARGQQVGEAGAPVGRAPCDAGLDAMPLQCIGQHLAARRDQRVEYRLRTGHGPAVMGIFRRAALNMVRTVQQNLGTDVSIRLLRDRIGRHSWILATALP